MSSNFMSNDNMDEFDQKMAGILQGSIAMVFRQLIEPVDSISSKHDIESTKPSSPPPLKLHDFGGSDFIRLAEKSRHNRRSRQDKEWKCIQECLVRSDGSDYQ